MSVINVQGTDIDFNISIKSANLFDLETTGESSTFNIDVGIISYLEIEDNLVDTGLKGTIALKNMYGIFDRIKALRDSSRTFFIDINFQDVKSNNRPTDKQISFLGLIENTSSLTADIVDDNIILRFEEAQTAMLKKASLAKLPSHEYGKPATPNSIIKQLIELWINNIVRRKAQESDLIANELQSDILASEESGLFDVNGNGVKGSIRSFWTEITDSIYDVINRAKRTMLQENRKLSLLKIKNVEDKNKQIKRVFTLGELFTDQHREFITAFVNKQPGNFSEVYGEEFVLSPQDNINPKNASIYNEVESYNLVRADIKSARESFWCDHQIVAHGESLNPVDLVKTSTPIIPFSSIVDNFEELDLGTDNRGNIFSNTPALRLSERKLMAISTVDSEINSAEIIENQIYNKVKNSLIFLNDTIVFTVKGQVYRKPGVFISITGGDVITDNNDNILNNLWFVISVKHKYKEMNYVTEISAVRLFGNQEKYSSLVQELVE